MWDVMGRLDRDILAAINGLAGSSPPMDEFVGFVGRAVLLKGMLPMLFFWGLWFLGGPRQRERWCKLLAMLVVAGLALVAGRTLALVLPFRLRPIHTEGIDLVMPHGMHAGVLDGWSSMPSDHAVLFFAMATGLFLVNRTVGTLAFLHAILVISLPRIYLGLHLPSDLLVGALVGIGMTLLLLPPMARLIARLGIPELEPAYPHLWYPTLFLATFLCAGMFGSLIEMLRMALRITRAMLA
jgi:undecaprenyl-diphosphatase